MRKTTYLLLPASVAGLLLLAACSDTSTAPPSAYDPASSSSAAQQISSSRETGTASTNPTSNATASTSRPLSSTPAQTQPRVLTMDVSNFQFAPNVVTFKKGENVIIRLTNIAGEHSFQSTALGIDTIVPEGQTVDIPVPTGTAGVYDFRCGIPCGPGHRDMTGQIIIQ